MNHVRIGMIPYKPRIQRRPYQRSPAPLISSFLFCAVRNIHLAGQLASTPTAT
jgi:hypothetical protein